VKLLDQGEPQSARAPLPRSLSSQVCVAPLVLRGLQSRVSDSAMIDKPEPRPFPPPWFAEKGADSKFADRYLYWRGVEALGSVGR
jgi:hypothetical protein